MLYTKVCHVFVLLTVASTMAEERVTKRTRGRTAYSLQTSSQTEGSAGDEKVKAPFSEMKEGFITEVTYNSGENLTAKLNKKKDIVKFIPVNRNVTELSKQAKERENELKKRKDKTTRKKAKFPIKFEYTSEKEPKEEVESTNEQKTKVRLRQKIPRQGNLAQINKVLTEIKDNNSNDNYPKPERNQGFKFSKPFPSRNILGNTSNNSLPAELNGLMVMANPPDLDEVAKRTHDNNSKHLQFSNEGEQTANQPRKLSFPRPVKDLVILKPEFKQSKKIVKFEDVISKQKKLKPEPKPTTTTTEKPVQIKKLDFSRKVELKPLTTSTTEQPVQIKKLDFTRKNKLPSLQNTKSTRGIDTNFSQVTENNRQNSERESIKDTISKLKKFNVPAIKQSEVILVHNDVPKAVPSPDWLNKNENHFKLPNNHKFEQIKTLKTESLHTKAIQNVRKPQNEVTQQKSPVISTNKNINKSPSKIRGEAIYESSPDFIDSADVEFDYTSGFPESKLEFGSKDGSTNSEKENIKKANIGKTEATGVKVKSIQDVRQRKQPIVSRFKTKKPEVKKNHEESITENYPKVRPTGQRFKPRDKENNQLNQVLSYDDNQTKKKKKVKDMQKDEDKTIITRFNKAVHKKRVEGVKQNVIPFKDAGNDGTKEEQVDTSTSHYPVKQDPPKPQDHVISHSGYPQDVLAYRPETTTYNYLSSDGSPMGEFEKYLRDLSSNVNVPINQDNYNNKPPQSTNNHFDYSHTKNYDNDDWQPINYNYVPNKHNDYNPNSEIKYFYDQKGASVYSSGIHDNGQTYYGYHIRSPGASNNNPSYNWIPQQSKPAIPQTPVYNHASNFDSTNFYDQKQPSVDFNSYQKTNYDTKSYYNYKPNVVANTYTGQNSNYNFGTSTSYRKPHLDSNYVATSHQSLIRLSDTNHPLKSFHDFTVHHRY